MKLYLARHGETTWNVLDKICGRTDVPLTENGERQAEALAEKLRDIPLDRIIVSPLMRAQRTAAPTAAMHNLPIETDNRLIEQDYGIYEGLNRFDEGFLNNKRQFAFCYPGGESMMQVAARTYTLVEELGRKYPEENILLVCHGGVCRVLRTYFLDMTNDAFFHYAQDNGAFEVFDYPRQTKETF